MDIDTAQKILLQCNKSQKEALILELGEKWLNKEIENADNA